MAQLAALSVAQATRYREQEGDQADVNHNLVRKAHDTVTSLAAKYPRQPQVFDLQLKIFRLEWEIAKTDEAFERVTKIIHSRLVRKKNRKKERKKKKKKREQRKEKKRREEKQTIVPPFLSLLLPLQLSSFMYLLLYYFSCQQNQQHGNLELHLLLSSLNEMHGKVEEAFRHSQLVGAHLLHVPQSERWLRWVIGLNTRILAQLKRQNVADEPQPSDATLPSAVEVHTARLSAHIALAQHLQLSGHWKDAARQISELDRALFEAKLDLRSSYEDIAAWPVLENEFRAQLYFHIGLFTH